MFDFEFDLDEDYYEERGRRYKYLFIDNCFGGVFVRRRSLS